MTLQREDALAMLKKHDLEDPLQNTALAKETQDQLKEMSKSSLLIHFSCHILSVFI